MNPDLPRMIFEDLQQRCAAHQELLRMKQTTKQEMEVTSRKIALLRELIELETGERL